LPDPIDLVELSAGHAPQSRWTRSSGSGRFGSVEDILGASIPKRAYHALHYNERHDMPGEARELGVGPTTLARMWILERLRQVVAAGKSA